MTEWRVAVVYERPDVEPNSEWVYRATTVGADKLAAELGKRLNATVELVEGRTSELDLSPWTFVLLYAQDRTLARLPKGTRLERTILMNGGTDLPDRIAEQSLAGGYFSSYARWDHKTCQFVGRIDIAKKIGVETTTVGNDRARVLVMPRKDLVELIAAYLEALRAEAQASMTR